MIFLVKWLSRSQTSPRQPIWNRFQRAYGSRGMFLGLFGSRNTPNPRGIGIGG